MNTLIHPLIAALAASIFTTSAIAAPGDLDPGSGTGGKLTTTPPQRQNSIPFDQIGTAAQKQYSGDGISITPSMDGALLRADFQKLQARATPEGLWVESTEAQEKPEHFRLLAVGARVGQSPFASLSRNGHVHATAEVVRFFRPGVTEEYRVSMDGIRQDFLIAKRPAGSGELSILLEVSGAKVETAQDGVKLSLDTSGRAIAYSRLYVSDARGRILSARMEATAAGQIHIRVDDRNADYPIRIDPTFSDANWFGGFVLPGTSGEVRAIAVSSTNLYVAGKFDATSEVGANNIAKWDGSSWSALGSGVFCNVGVNALALSGTGELYAGGDIQTAGGVGVNGIAKWNGFEWSALGAGVDGGSNPYVSALAVTGTGDLVVGGTFSTAGGVTVNGIAKWNGTNWSALGSGVGGASPNVDVIALSGADLYAGGSFTTAGGVTVNGIAKWNGSVWSALGAGISGGSPVTTVLALAADGSGNLYAGGTFTAAGGVAGTSYIAKWNGAAWSALGSGMNSWVYALGVSGTDIYAGGAFTQAGGFEAEGIAKWNGAAWSAMGSGMRGRLYGSSVVYALALDGSGNLFAGGDFAEAGGVTANNVARWSGGSWSSLGRSGSGLSGHVAVLAVSGTDIYAGGTFTTAGGIRVNGIAKWNGTNWSALGSGVESFSQVVSLAVSGSALYVGGSFDVAGGVTVNGIAKWDGTTWTSLGTGLSGTQFRAPSAEALAVDGAGNVYVGGEFVAAGGVPAKNIAKWDGSAWSALGSGMSGGRYSSSVKALAVDSSGNLYAGGNFATAGGVTAYAVAEWNGAEWSALGVGIDPGGDPYVSALAASETGEVFVGGSFVTAGGVTVNGIAKWNGNEWSALGSGMDSGYFPEVSALVASGPYLYAGGLFYTADGVEVNRVAKWDGTAWSAFGPGIGGQVPHVTALAVSGVHLYVGGDFAVAGGKPSFYVARVTEVAPDSPTPVIRGPVAGEPEGTRYVAFNTPQVGAFLATISNGNTNLPAIVGSDRTVLLKVGGGVPSLGDSAISKLGQPSGDAVLATLKLSVAEQITAKNNVVLLRGLNSGTPQVAARIGTTNAALPPGVTIKSFGTIDGNGPDIFFLATLQGAGVTSRNALALCAAMADGSVRVLARVGDEVDGKKIATIGALVGSAATLAEGRWRVDDTTCGVRLTFADAAKSQAIYALPSSALSPADWTLLAQTGPVSSITGINGTTIRSFGLPGFGLGPSASVIANLAIVAGGPTAANHFALIKGTLGANTIVLARTGDTVAADANGAPLLNTKITGFTDPVAGADGKVAFGVSMIGKGGIAFRGIMFRNAGEAPELLANVGAAAPGGGHWSAFGSLVLPNGADIGPIILGTLAVRKADGVTALNNRGVWGLDNTGTLRLLLRSGQPIEINGATKTLASFTALTATPGSIGAASGHDQAGKVAVLAKCSDGTRAVFLVENP